MIKLAKLEQAGHMEPEDDHHSNQSIHLWISPRPILIPRNFSHLNPWSHPVHLNLKKLNWLQTLLGSSKSTGWVLGSRTAWSPSSTHPNIFKFTHLWGWWWATGSMSPEHPPMLLSLLLTFKFMAWPLLLLKVFPSYSSSPLLSLMSSLTLLAAHSLLLHTWLLAGISASHGSFLPWF